MAVDNYLKLRATIANTINRDDLSADVTAFEGTTIDSEIKRAVERATLRIQTDLVSRGGHKSMEAVDATISISAESGSFPSDFAGHRAFIINTNPITVLQFVDPTSLWTQYPNSTPDRPEKFTIVGTRTFYVRPLPDTAYATRLVYYQALTALSADTDTNWVLTSHWGVYEAAAMFELTLDVEDQTTPQFWKGQYDQLMNDLMGDDRAVRWAAVPTQPNIGVTIA
jgi:hypothetical protein